MVCQGEGRVHRNAAHCPLTATQRPPHTSMPDLARPDSALVAATT